MSLKINLASFEEKNEIYKALIDYSKELEQFQERPKGEIASEKYFEYYWTDPQRFPIVAHKNEELIGFCFLRAEEKYYSIAEFYIKPKFRRLGYGKTVLNFTIEFCRKQGIHSSIIANSFVKNLGANTFWIRNGFIKQKEVIFENEKYYCNIKEF
ncbi:MAG: GNAT family N-acetyltransferase [Promethearchaeota archaeon]